MKETLSSETHTHTQRQNDQRESGEGKKMRGLEDGWSET